MQMPEHPPGQDEDDNSDTSRIESALVGLLADLLDHLDGNERDLDVIAEDIISEFGLRDAVHAARTGATVDPETQA